MLTSALDLSFCGIAGGLLVLGGADTATAIGIGLLVWVLRPWPPGSKGYG